MKYTGFINKEDDVLEVYINPDNNLYLCIRHENNNGVIHCKSRNRRYSDTDKNPTRGKRIFRQSVRNTGITERWLI